MFNAGAPEFCVDQSLYYPSATSYGYIGTGIEPTADNYGYYGLNGQDTQYHGAATEDFQQYLYYPPGYGYVQSYNPYNPFIPGAMVGGADGSFVTPQQYYALPSYEMPMVLQSMPDTANNGIADKVLSVGQFNRTEENQRKSFPRAAEGSRGNNGSSKHRGFASVNFPSQAATQVLPARGGQGTDNSSLEKALLDRGQLGNGFSSAKGLCSLSSSNHTTQSSVNEVSSENQLVVKARTSLAGNPDAQGNITIFRDQYNSVDFPIDYKYAKFCVIKSFSEDDVHKSIKYNVWSSTLNGNKKLNAAYESSQRIGGCPIFLFFSVNASGQYCGVAEMTGPVDFEKNMDFWQQNKWKGCFPVKWHFVKDLPNSSFRQIILENNENKPVTQSRDTQEIPYKKGLEMLRIFKSYKSKTSLLDDFMYYENRQQVMQEERVRLLIKNYENSYLVSLPDPPRKLQSLHDMNASKHGKDCSSIENANEEANVPVMNPSVNMNVTDPTVLTGSNQILADPVPNMVGELRISSLSITSQVDKTESSLNSESVGKSVGESVGVVTIGSMPVKLNGTISTFLNVGTIPLDQRACQ